MIVVLWNKNGMRLRVLDVFQGHDDETRLMVCKVTAPDPIMGRFSVRADQTSILDYLEDEEMRETRSESNSHQICLGVT